jgi:hypothetical protein
MLTVFYFRSGWKIERKISVCENYCCFHDKEYYRKTVPFIEVRWLFDQEKGA